MDVPHTKNSVVPSRYFVLRFRPTRSQTDRDDLLVVLAATQRNGRFRIVLNLKCGTDRTDYTPATAFGLASRTHLCRQGYGT